MYLIALVQQELGKIGTVLSRDSRNQRALC